MNKHHRLVMSKKQYPGGLRFIECQDCAYALAVEVDQRGIIQMSSKIKINAGDLKAAHSYYHGR